MTETFTHDVFLSHSSKDKDVVRPIAERLKADGVRVWFDEWEIMPGDSIPAKIEEGLERSRVLVFCMSANAFGSDWAQLESGTFRFRDPLNKERRFIPLRLDDAPIRGSLAQFLYVDWLPQDRDQGHAKLLEACRLPALEYEKVVTTNIQESFACFQSIGALNDWWAVAVSSDLRYALISEKNVVRSWDLENSLPLAAYEGHTANICSVVYSANNLFAATASDDTTVRVWSVTTGNCVHILKGHTESVRSLSFNSKSNLLLSGSKDRSVRVWDLNSGMCVTVLKGHTGIVGHVEWTQDDSFRAVSGGTDGIVRVWDTMTGRSLYSLVGHTDYIGSLVCRRTQHQVISGSRDGTIRLWDIDTGLCLVVFEGHTKGVWSLAESTDGRFLVSASSDRTLRVWDLENGVCLSVLTGYTTGAYKAGWVVNGTQVWSLQNCGGGGCTFNFWDLNDLVSLTDSSKLVDSAQYTNAKILLVGDTSSGKTGLAHRLATGRWKPSDGSTVGAWSTQWQLSGVDATKELDREIWLWDFGGQADQRLIHQLYMDHTAMILLLFDADKEDVLPGLRDWQTALRRCVPESTSLLLVAGRVDAGFRASRDKLKRYAEEQGFRYFETSAKDGTGCDDLVKAITEGIPWGQMEQRTSPRIFKLIKDQILKLRDEGQVLHTFKELRDLLWQRLADEPRFSDDILKTVIGLLDGPGAVKELEYGTYILLQPEWINAYAQAVIRTLRQEPSELGCLPLRSIAEGKLLFQSVERDGSILEMKRLPEAEERVVLREMERQMEERGLCLRQGDKLVFPSHCGRERPEVVTHPSVFVSYAVKGYLDDIYATLVVKLADSGSFTLKELWRDAADFNTLVVARRMGVKLVRESACNGEIKVYFSPGVSQAEQVIFANYIHAHLVSCCEDVQRLRHYVCPHCHTPKGNPQVLMKRLLLQKQAADTECDMCGKRFVLWDALEQQFASDEVREQVEGLQAGDIIRLDTRRKGKLLVLEVMARISSADQKCFEIPATEDEGLDVELEFTYDSGKGTGSRLYLQLKSGNSHLRIKKDGTEIFDIKEQRWVEYWLKQPHPVMLVVGTFAEEDKWTSGKDKLEFANVRWMEISSELKRLSANGTQPVKHIEFKGERLDMDSIYRWRSRVLADTLQ